PYRCLFNHIGIAPTDSYPLSLPDALPILAQQAQDAHHVVLRTAAAFVGAGDRGVLRAGGLFADPASLRDRAGQVAIDEVHRKLRSEEHTSELQSRENLVCRLLLEKKKYAY